MNYWRNILAFKEKLLCMLLKGSQSKPVFLIHALQCSLFPQK